MPPARTHVKITHRAAFIASTLIFLSLVGGSIFFLQGNHDYTDCQHHNYNNKLNGGIKEFNGKKYTINICGSGINNSHLFGDGMDSVQLTVTDAQGEILAKRYYKVFWDGQPGHEPLRTGPDSITYQDDEKQADYTITMPPTVIDWARARIPFFN
ncbi:hypothetical protein DIE23_27210 [Burkholderia sp. Bp9143]|uniref:hypothetical protein n=1 Tax=Burkholderia sp. Bp9143 TaxID=2184574 RepID=UPI000F5B6677|nr:hypothetical protein [Burkholderia sp. Bp9143]RQR27368.1 hypothetical protein DIE23_27210 [Burkholderia sp. Bp9143]